MLKVIAGSVLPNFCLQIYLKGRVEGKWGKEHLPTGSLPRWPQQLGKANTWSPIPGLPRGWQGPKHLGYFSTAFPCALVGNWIRSEATGTKTGTDQPAPYLSCKAEGPLLRSPV